jgi:rhodanese-related sulfurtransferase
MYLVLFLLLIASLFVAIKNINAQTHVENKSFDLMLSTLLSHSAKEVGVAEVSNDTLSVFLDSREKKEFEVSHIKNAIWVGYEDFDTARLKNIAKDEKIIVYCSVGYRSEKIAERLLASGYTNVVNLYGGIFEWVNQDKPVVDQTGNETEFVHAYSKKWGIWLNEGVKVYE